MPYNWTRIPSSPPRARRDEVAQLCRSHGGRLCENQIFYDGNGDTYALVMLPADEAKQRDLLADLGAMGQVGLVDADEKAGGGSPPRADRKS